MISSSWPTSRSPAKLGQLLHLRGEFAPGGTVGETTAKPGVGQEPLRPFGWPRDSSFMVTVRTLWYTIANLPDVVGVIGLQSASGDSIL